MSEPTIVTITQTIDDQLAAANKRIQEITEKLQRCQAEAQAKLDAQATDWKKLNEFLNAYATNEGLCEAYEDKIDEWNTKFAQFKLTGRRKSFVVKVQVKLQYETEIEVNALNSDSAKEKIDDLDSYDVLEGLSIGDYDDIDYSPLSAREGHL